MQPRNRGRRADSATARDLAGRVGLTVPGAQEAQEGPNTPVGRADQADRVGRATTAGQEGQATAAQADPAGPADLMTAVGTGARHPPICPGAGWTRAGSTTSRSTTTAGG